MILLPLSPILPEDLANRVCYHCRNHTSADVHVLSDLSSYCCFEETLMPSEVVTYTIYLYRYAIAALMAITCTNESGQLR